MTIVYRTSRAQRALTLQRSLIKLIFFRYSFLMATGGEGNESQIQLGYGSCVWGTGRVTACPPGPGGATQGSSVAGTVSDQDELYQSGRHGE